MVNEYEADPDAFSETTTVGEFRMAGASATPENELSLFLEVSPNSLDSAGLIGPGSLELTWFNNGTSRLDAFGAAESPFDEHLNNLGTGSIGVCSMETYGTAEHHEFGPTLESMIDSITSRNVAPVQNFDTASPVSSYDESTGSWRVEYAPEEVQGLIDKFGGLAGTTAAEVIEEKMRSMAIEVLQTFPSRELHFSKVKSLMLKTSNLAAFAVSEGNQNVTLSLERMGAGYEGTS
jgi:hypothetical protein|tara:strand:+ start:839 stop:1543 length:705 start_codon:yes stop_codon:yes gene_type:complete